MKLIFSLIIIASGLSATAQTPSASSVLNKAKAEAAQSGKNVFVIFHASWCGWCHKMDNTMNEADLKPFFQNNYVITHLTVMESKDKKDLENPGADKLLVDYHGDKGGIPFWYVIDKNGKLLADSRMDESDGKKGDNVGCPARPDEVDYFIKVLKNTSSLNDAQLSAVKARFLKNAE